MSPLVQRERSGSTAPLLDVEAAVAAAPVAPNRLRRALAISEASVLVSLAGLVLVFWLLEPAFLSGTNVRSMLSAISFVGIIAVGQVLLLVAGEFDLSVGSTAGLSAIVSAWLMTKGGLPVGLGILGGLGTGALVGLVNGLLVVGLGIPAFIGTLGMLYAAKGFTYVITNGYPIYPLPRVIGRIGSAEVIFGLGWSFVLLVVLAVIGDVVLRRTAIGRNLFATGGNEEVARLVGIPTGRYKILAFMVVGMLSSVAGMLVLADGASGTPSIGQGWELTVIAGVVIGGVSLFGGVGTVAAGIVGMLLLQVVQSGLVVVGVNPNWQTVAVGLIMILAVGVDVTRRRVSLSGGSRRRRNAAGAERETAPAQGA
jgi:ribose transport system permease protein